MARELLSYREFGKGSEVLICLAGFPDNEISGWGEILDHLQTAPYSKYRVVCVCLPDFEDEPLAQPRRKWGYSWDEIIALLDATISHVVPDPNKKVALMIHDWGSYGGLMYENRHPERVSKIVCLDVAMGISKGKSLFPPYLIVVLYQLWWAWAYFLSQALHASIGSLVFALYSLLVPSWFRPTPMQAKDIPRPTAQISVQLCYPYYHFWKDMLFSTTKSRLSLIPRPVSCPILFCYGTHKNVMFHKPGFLKWIDRRTDGSKQVAIEGAGHWLSRGAAASAVCKEMDGFLLGR